MNNPSSNHLIVTGYNNGTVPIDLIMAMGYRKVSNNHCIVTRIDREDWVEYLAQKMRRAPADFIVRDGSGMISPSWCDHYRRTYSNDKIYVTREDIKKFKGSGYDPIGYVDINNIKLSHPEFFI